METFFDVDADQIEVGDQILVDGDPIEVTDLPESDDPDAVVIVGYSHESGDKVRYEVLFSDSFSVWGI